MKAIRLRSLRIDPDSFCSKYVTEVDQPDEFWLNGLRPQLVHHFVATQTVAQDRKQAASGEQREFLAFMVVIYEAAITEGDMSLPTYCLSALWVDPAIRGKGVGTMIITESIDWIRRDAKERGFRKVRYRLIALTNNERGIALYT